MLIDPDKRPKYDMHGEDGLKPDQQRGGGGFGDFFGFGGGRQQDGEKRKDDTPMDIEVTLQELYLGSSRTVRRPESLLSPAFVRECVFPQEEHRHPNTERRRAHI